MRRWMRVDAFDCVPVFVYASSDCGCYIMRVLARSSPGIFLFWSQDVWICLCRLVVSGLFICCIHVCWQIHCCFEFATLILRASSTAVVTIGLIDPDRAERWVDEASVLLLLYFSLSLWAEDAPMTFSQASMSGWLTQRDSKNQHTKKFETANVTVVQKYKSDKFSPPLV